MQIATNGDKFNERESKNKECEYSIMYDAGRGLWTVDCWLPDGENHWTMSFWDSRTYPSKTEVGVTWTAEQAALYEFNRFE